MNKCKAAMVALTVATFIAVPRGFTAEENRLTFRVKVSALGLKATSSFAAGKAPTDVIEVNLSGRLYDPPRPVAIVTKGGADRSTPESVANSDFSANLAGDLDWMAENFVDAEQGEVKAFFSDPTMLQKNRQMFEGAKIWLTGHARYKDYALLFQRMDHEGRQGAARPVVYSQTQNGWRRTNALSRDETYDVVFSALNSGEVLQGK